MDLDDEELKVTRMMNGADRKGRVNKMEQDINELKRLLHRDRLTQYGKRKFIEYYEQRIKQLEEKLDETLNANLALVQGNANSIPVSLVEEKIEELIKEGRHYNANKIEVLQELLEKRK